MKKTNLSLFAAFSIIELMIGIFIFSLGLVSVYALLVTSLKVNDYNKNVIIASNLAHEQLELLRNIRDTNYEKLQLWDQKNPEHPFHSPSDRITHNIPTSGLYYIVENDFSSSASFSTKLVDITSSFVVGEDKLLDANMKQYQLCIESSLGIYRDCPPTLSPSDTETFFYRYLHIIPASYADGTLIPDTVQMNSTVVWYKRGYHEFNIKTLMTDWRRI